MGDGGWTARVNASARAAIAPRERIGGAEWADRERWIGTDEGCPLPGQWTSLPWQVEILDALADPSIEWLAIKKATQVGVSELVRNAIGRWAIHDPGDVLWVMTTQAAAERAMVKLRKMFRNTPVLRPLLSERRTDTTLLELVLVNGMRIVIGWAGSAASLASDPFRRVVLDEAAYYKWAVQGGSPIHLADDRTKTAGRRRKVVLLSSPREEGDAICTSYRDASDRRVFTVPCPTCGLVQPWEWERVRWPGGSVIEAPTEPDIRLALAEAVKRDQSAWMSCLATGCAGKIEPMVRMRALGALWAQEEPAQPSERRAYHVPEAWHWETSLSSLVAKFLRATTPAALGTFYTGSLGLVLKLSSAPIEASLIRSRAVHPDRLVPAWATAIIATADTQLDHFWLTIRAHAPGGKSRGLDWGRVNSFAELRARALEQRFPVEGGGTATPRFLLIDSGGGMETPDGNRTHQVYEFALETPHVLPCKGEADLEVYKSSPYRKSKVTFSPDGGAEREVELTLLHVEYWKDNAAAQIRGLGWEEPGSAASPEYGRQLSSEHKVTHLMPNGSSYSRWVKRSSHAQDHLWDCTWMQVAGAAIAQLNGEAPIPQRIEARKKRKTTKQEPKRARMPDGRPYHVGRR